MNRRSPVASMSASAAPRKVLGLRAWVLFVFGIVLITSASYAAPASGPAGKQAAQPVASDFVGSDTCATCHEDVAKGFASNPHTKMAQMHGKNDVTCENCHGPGKAHVDGGGDVTKIFNPAKAPQKEVTKTCLACHAGQHSNFERSAHGEGNIGCTTCHSVHASKEPDHLLKAAAPGLCFQCHADVKPQFSMPFHHRVEEGVVNCTDCHDPHGTFKDKGLRASAQQDLVCTKCHSETAGPYVYEHAVIKTEGCTACHFPHGGPNPRLLNRANVNTICLQCHTASPNFTTSEPMGPTHNQAAQYQACTICHNEIHGSNVSAVFFNTH